MNHRYTCTYRVESAASQSHVDVDALELFQFRILAALTHRYHAHTTLFHNKLTAQYGHMHRSTLLPKYRCQTHIGRKLSKPRTFSII